MKSVNQALSVDTRPSKEVVVNSLTRDISIDACIFDLIDNSIDAARDTIFKLNPGLDVNLPPENYGNFEIILAVDGSSLEISDNCGGIPASLLESSVLRFGEKSSHSLGIGVFGVGLNRAIFKIGKHTDITTDTGIERCHVEIKTDEYLDSPDWKLPATKMPTKGKVGTTIKTTGLSNETSQLFADDEWVDKLRRETGIRYGKHISKNLKIEINKKEVEPIIVEIRQDSPYSSQSKFFRHETTAIYIEAGQHKKHRFPAEPDYIKDANAELTGEYGWTVYCNERAIVIADKSRKTGWVHKFHSEFNGFVGNIYFTDSNPANLPWNTSKTDVDLNNPAYQLALEDMHKFVDKWRANAGDAKRRKKKNLPLVVPGPASPAANVQATVSTKPTSSPAPKESSAPAAAPAPAPPVTKPAFVTKVDHNTFSTILPPDINEVYCDDKHLALVHEGKRLDLNVMTYSALVLMRMLFEASTIKFLSRKGMYDDLLAEVIKSRNDARKKRGAKELSQKEISGIDPDLDELITYLLEHEEVWDKVRKNKIQHSLRKFLGHKKLLNSAAHNTFQTINKLSAFEIREDILPALRYLIEE